MIETTDRVLGGANGPANAQARALAARSAWLKDTVAEITGTLGAAQSRIADSEAAASQALSDAQAAAALADSADNAAGAAQLAAATAASTAAAAQAAAVAAQTAAGTATSAASTAQTTAAIADTKATTADTKATTAVSTADAAQTAVAAKATRFDLGGVTILYTAAVILGAGARSIEVNCTGAQVGDAIFVAPTGAIPDGYAVGAAQTAVAGKIRVSVVHPALALGANFSIPLRVFALR